MMPVGLCRPEELSLGKVMACVLRIGFGEVGTIELESIEFPIAVNGNLGREMVRVLVRPRTIDR